MHVYPCLQIVYTFKSINYYIVHCRIVCFAFESLESLHPNQSSFAVSTPRTLTDHGSNQRRRAQDVQSVAPLEGCTLHFKILQTVSGLFEMMARDGLKLKWYN